MEVWAWEGREWEILSVGYPGNGIDGDHGRDVGWKLPSMLIFSQETGRLLFWDSAVYEMILSSCDRCLSSNKIIDIILELPREILASQHTLKFPTNPRLSDYQEEIRPLQFLVHLICLKAAIMFPCGLGIGARLLMVCRHLFICAAIAEIDSNCSWEMWT